MVEIGSTVRYGRYIGPPDEDEVVDLAVIPNKTTKEIKGLKTKLLSHQAMYTLAREGENFDPIEAPVTCKRIC